MTDAAGNVCRHSRERRPLHNHRHSREACPREDGERESRGGMDGTVSHEFAYLLIHSDLGDEVDQGFAKVSESGNP